LVWQEKESIEVKSEEEGLQIFKKICNKYKCKEVD
jgi:hypothetical protein